MERSIIALVLCISGLLVACGAASPEPLFDELRAADAADADRPEPSVDDDDDDDDDAGRLKGPPASAPPADDEPEPTALAAVVAPLDESALDDDPPEVEPLDEPPPPAPAPEPVVEYWPTEAELAACEAAADPGVVCERSPQCYSTEDCRACRDELGVDCTMYWCDTVEECADGLVCAANVDGGHAVCREPRVEAYLPCTTTSECEVGLRCAAWFDPADKRCQP